MDADAIMILGLPDREGTDDHIHLRRRRSPPNGVNDGVEPLGRSVATERHQHATDHAHGPARRWLGKSRVEERIARTEEIHAVRLAAIAELRCVEASVHHHVDRGGAVGQVVEQDRAWHTGSKALEEGGGRRIRIDDDDVGRPVIERGDADVGSLEPIARFEFQPPPPISRRFHRNVTGHEQPRVGSELDGGEAERHAATKVSEARAAPDLGQDRQTERRAHRA